MGNSQQKSDIYNYDDVFRRIKSEFKTHGFKYSPNNSLSSIVDYKSYDDKSYEVEYKSYDDEYKSHEDEYKSYGDDDKHKKELQDIIIAHENRRLRTSKRRASIN